MVPFYRNGPRAAPHGWRTVPVGAYVAVASRLPPRDVTAVTNPTCRPSAEGLQMVMWRTPRSPLAFLAAWLLCLGPLACTSIDGPTSDVDEWKKDWSTRATAVKDGAAAGAQAVGRSMGTAYRGVREGFEEPDASAYGPYPKGYADAIRRHMLRFEGVPKEASFRFGKPEKAYMNAGILAGGEIEWQGWVVDVAVETTTFAGQKRSKAYAVRMTNGEVEEVQDAAYAKASVHRLSDETQPAAVAK